RRRCPQCMANAREARPKMPYHQGSRVVWLTEVNTGKNHILQTLVGLERKIERIHWLERARIVEPPARLEFFEGSYRRLEILTQTVVRPFADPNERSRQRLFHAFQNFDFVALDVDLEEQSFGRKPFGGEHIVALHERRHLRLNHQLPIAFEDTIGG